MTKQQFIDRWVAEVQRQRAKPHNCTSSWEAVQALRELADMYPRRRFTSGSLCRKKYIEDLVREASRYQAERAQVAESNQAFKEVLKLLAKIQVKIRRQTKFVQKKSGGAFRCVANALGDLQKDVERRTSELRTWYSGFWYRTLAAYPSMKADFKNVWIALPSSEEWDLRHEERYTGGVARGVKRSSELPGLNAAPKRTIDLDRRFQLRAARIIEREFSDLSMETLARMVVLVYLCFGLAHECAGELEIVPGSGKLTIGAVYEKLKRHKRNRAKGSTMGVRHDS